MVAGGVGDEHEPRAGAELLGELPRQVGRAQSRERARMHGGQRDRGARPAVAEEGEQADAEVDRRGELSEERLQLTRGTGVAESHVIQERSDQGDSRALEFALQRPVRRSEEGDRAEEPDDDKEDGGDQYPYGRRRQHIQADQREDRLQQSRRERGAVVRAREPVEAHLPEPHRRSGEERREKDHPGRLGRPDRERTAPHKNDRQLEDEHGETEERRPAYLQSTAERRREGTRQETGDDRRDGEHEEEALVEVDRPEAPEDDREEGTENEDPAQRDRDRGRSEEQRAPMGDARAFRLGRRHTGVRRHGRVGPPRGWTGNRRRAPAPP
jgi:hypothetical protein